MKTYLFHSIAAVSLCIAPIGAATSITPPDPPDPPIAPPPAPMEVVPFKKVLDEMIARFEANPKDSGALHELARAHAIAYSRNMADSESITRPKGNPHLWLNGKQIDAIDYGYDDETDDEALRLSSEAHLQSAIALYKKIFTINPDPEARVAMDLAWCQMEVGDLESAKTILRAAVRRAWKRENRDIIMVDDKVWLPEISKQLIPLLDPKTEAAEIADIQRKANKISGIPRMVVCPGPKDLPAPPSPPVSIPPVPTIPPGSKQVPEKPDLPYPNPGPGIPIPNDEYKKLNK